MSVNGDLKKQLELAQELIEKQHILEQEKESILECAKERIRYMMELIKSDTTLNEEEKKKLIRILNIEKGKLLIEF